MKLKSVKFDFGTATVRWDYVPHEHEGANYQYYVHVIREGVERYWHTNRKCNKTESLKYARSTKR
jgi:hypothetical protein